LLANNNVDGRHLSKQRRTGAKLNFFSGCDEMQIGPDIKRRRVFAAGRLAARRGPDHSDPGHQSCDAQLAHISDPRQPQNVEPAYQAGEGGRPRLLHVPDQHQRHEEADWLRRRPW
jgi:hypothetical protein